jgi:hypothetical protein
MSNVGAGIQKPDPLREQLDELDQLMERMLALGVSRPGREPAGKLGPPRAPSLVEALPSMPETETEQVIESARTIVELAPALSTEDNQVAELTGESAPKNVLPELEILSPAPLPGPVVESPVDLALPSPTFVALEIGPTAPAAQIFTDFQFAPSPSELALEAIESPAPPPPAPAPTITETAEPLVFVAWWLRPLSLVNNVYDGSTSWLGPIGRGLRSRQVKNLLGLCGLAALLGAMAWMVWENTDWNS